MNHTESAAKLAELAPLLAELAALPALYPYTPGGDWRAVVTPYGVMAVALTLTEDRHGAGAGMPTERAELIAEPAYGVTDDGTVIRTEADLAERYNRPAITAHPAAVDTESLTQRVAAVRVNGRAYTDAVRVTRYRDGAPMVTGYGYRSELTDSARAKLAAALGPVLADMDTPAARQAIRTRSAIGTAASRTDDAAKAAREALAALTAAGLIGGDR